MTARLRVGPANGVKARAVPPKRWGQRAEFCNPDVLPLELRRDRKRFRAAEADAMAGRAILGARHRLKHLDRMSNAGGPAGLLASVLRSG